MTNLREELSKVERPVPILSRERAAEFTQRQREVLDGLQTLFEGGFAHLTMASIAAEMSCSLRLLYQIAPSRDELVEIVVDRNLWAVGRTATATVTDSDDPIRALRTYLQAATEAVRRTTPEFAGDIRKVPGALKLNQAHERYLIDMTTCLLEVAVKDGVVGDIDTTAVARVLAGLGGLFASVDEISSIRSTPKDAADRIADLIIAGLLADRSR